MTNEDAKALLDALRWGTVDYMGFRDITEYGMRIAGGLNGQNSKVDELVAAANGNSAELERLQAENELMRKPLLRYTEDGEVERHDAWTPVNASRLADLEATEEEAERLRALPDLLVEAARRLGDMVQMFRTPGCPDCYRAKLDGDLPCAECSCVADAEELLARLDDRAARELGWDKEVRNG